MSLCNRRSSFLRRLISGLGVGAVLAALGGILRAAPPTTGPGGPILIVASNANPFSHYYAEILRAEGLNAFSVMDVLDVDASILGNYDVVILGETPVTAAQTTMFSNWVFAGGNLIAMRPDKQLASLLGLADAGATLSNGYLLVDTSAAPGAGIVGQTIQFHGAADLYTPYDATPVATLYSTAAASTTNPAVTVRSWGSSGGHAAAFTYDLAKSVIYTRQGNPAWSGQERDGLAPIRSDDLFFGGGQPNYVDLSKVAIPQADEQQRLLTNLIGFINASRKPVPKFWYFPRGLKAAVVMTGDDHGNGGTVGRFNGYKAISPAGCNVANWECIRGTSYIYPNTPITTAQVAAYVAQGFEIGVHMWMSGPLTGPMDCNNYTPSSISADYTNQLAQFAALYPGALPVRTNRTHCIVWSDYDTQPQTALAHGIRFDTNYYYWPQAWVNNVPGLFTGSGMPMRFAKADGTMIDVYQAPSQMTDESGQAFPFTVDTLLDRALGSEGYYGAFVANMHTDYNPSAGSVGSDAIVFSAQARGVPVVSAKQMLDWVDGRNGSTFDAIAWDGHTLTFSVSAAAGANGLQGMLPTTFAGHPLVGITRNGTPAAYSYQTIKGVSYALFDSTSASYQAQYEADVVAPVVSGVVATPGITSATVTWNTNEAATSRVDYGNDPSALGFVATASGLGTAHTVTLAGLSANTAYFYRVTSVDANGNSTTDPPAFSAPASFLTSPQPVLNCPCTIWSPSQAPGQPSAADSDALEVGVKFRAAYDGFITGIRFYKGAANTGVHVGSLWTAGGMLLGRATFTVETGSGWQEATLASPVRLTANTTYVASYHTDTGRYAADLLYFQSSGVVNGPLQAPANGAYGANGVYKYGPMAFPTDTFQSANYWVDVVYDVDVTPPTVTGVTPAAGASGVALATTATATFSEAINPASLDNSTFELRDPAHTLVAATVTYDSATRTATLQPVAGLAVSTTYTARVFGGSTGIRDLAGNALASSVSWSFTTGGPPPLTLTDTTAADFGAGTPNSGVYLSQTGDGEVILAPQAGTEFSGTTLPGGWSSTSWNTGATTTVAGGQLTLDGARASLDALLPPGQRLEFVATFSPTAGFQHVGFGIAFTDPPWAIFSTGAGSALYARTNDGIRVVDTLIPGNWLGTPRRFRIDWTGPTVTFFIDGTQVATRASGLNMNLRPIASDYAIGNGTLSVDWMRVSPYASSGLFTSRILDAGSSQSWSTVSWNTVVPPATNLAIAARFGDTPEPDGSWTSFIGIPNSGAAPVSATSRYVQYQATLSGNGTDSPGIAGSDDHVRRAAE